MVLFGPKQPPGFPIPPLKHLVISVIVSRVATQPVVVVGSPPLAAAHWTAVRHSGFKPFMNGNSMSAAHASEGATSAPFSATHRATFMVFSSTNGAAAHNTLAFPSPGWARQV